jgi:hypothetical protein
MVFTTDKHGTAKQVLQRYRVRWQIELVFKRLKPLLRLGHLPNTTMTAHGAGAMENSCGSSDSKTNPNQTRYFPWGYILSESVKQPVA